MHRGMRPRYPYGAAGCKARPIKSASLIWNTLRRAIGACAPSTVSKRVWFISSIIPWGKRTISPKTGTAVAPASRARSANDVKELGLTVYEQSPKMGRHIVANKEGKLQTSYPTAWMQVGTPTRARAGRLEVAVEEPWSPGFFVHWECFCSCSVMAPRNPVSDANVDKSAK